ncbi:MAG: YbhB/YbcL family Raf kinase inhibitor-like protein [Myxococcales bacterium]|nr:YbhB/YbcL family Raf kinase inhibitor-like protein [Myxococcales bacterium]
MRTAVAASLMLATLACGGDDGPGTATDAAAVDADGDAPTQPDAAAPDGAGADAPAGTLALISPVITEGGVIPPMFSCRGTNVSPALAWTGGPTAPGYAVVLTDRSNNLVHAIIWDVPGALAALPEDVDKLAEPLDVPGAKQPLAYDGQTRGYLGPCPGTTHTYEFALYAVDANPLPGLSLASTRAQVLAAITAHDTASATLTATFTP